MNVLNYPKECVILKSTCKCFGNAYLELNLQISRLGTFVKDVYLKKIILLQSRLIDDKKTTLN